MENMEETPDFGVLNNYFSEINEPKSFLDCLTDLIAEYSMLAIMQNEQVIPFETACRISMLRDIHEEVRKAVK